MEEKKKKKSNVKILIYAIEVIVIVAIFYFLIYPAATEDIPDKTEEVLIAQKTKEEKEKTMNQFNMIAEKYKSLSSEAGKIDKMISPAFDLPRTLFLFERLAADGGVIMEGINIGSAGSYEGEAQVSVVPVTFSVTGSYQSLKNYLDCLAENLPLIDVKSISFSSGEGNKGLYTFSLAVNTYIEKIESEESEEENGSEGSAEDDEEGDAEEAETESESE